jgi:hypothetical protein
MAWISFFIDGPIPIVIYGEPYADVDGYKVRDVVGYVPGYHVNIAHQVFTPELEPYAMTPSLPRRVFAGAETVFLKFADEAEARSALGAYWMEPTE